MYDVWKSTDLSDYADSLQPHPCQECGDLERDWCLRCGDNATTGCSDCGGPGLLCDACKATDCPHEDADLTCDWESWERDPCFNAGRDWDRDWVNDGECDGQGVVKTAYGYILGYCNCTETTLRKCACCGHIVDTAKRGHQ